MNLNIKLLTDKEDVACVNHGSTDDEVFELKFPTKGVKSTKNLILCLEALHTISRMGNQFGRNAFSPIGATITTPDKSS